ncbi:unnamed protein product [Cyclocybe aegerita]|uniref:DUF6533 domain-containing protein n=1 Tax=Cyclocybe aegerita TaxID=1973307 RepID=A0A8S0WE12_CYCAE|nr:unnamed protein product [Cyclocybe aegerita]
MELSNSDFIRLYELNLIPLRVVLASLVWVLHDYFVTLEDEVEYIWSQKRSLGKFMFLWVQYYTIFLVAFDTLQIHSFAIPGVASDKLCVAADPVTRLAGAISLWSVEVIMQLRIYALFNRSKRIALFNAVLFLASIGIFLWIMIVNAMKRGKAISQALHLPLPGCPVINGGTGWSLWIAPTVFEFTLFLFVVYKSIVSVSARIRLNQRVSLTAVLLQENILYFFSVACLLIFNNLMVVGATHIPWFGFGPFHAAIGIVTCRMLIHLRKFALENFDDSMNTYGRKRGPLRFEHTSYTTSTCD